MNSPARPLSPITLPMLKPLVWALACAFMPSMAWAQAVPDVRLPVPQAAGGAAVKGVGTYQVDAAKALGNIQQASQRAIYHWKSFDIGRDATVNFNMALPGSSALNRVLGGTRSEILGKLNANGNIFLINPNGVVFGAQSQVNVQGLVASTLNIDDDVFLGGLSTVGSESATYVWQDQLAEDGSVIATYDRAENFVRVDAGAQIKTPSGGQVYLMARRVDNAGQIETEGGQTVLAAGEKVWLKSPSAELGLYASEANPVIPATRGLLVEVSGAGDVTNLGEIMAKQGNVTLVGYAVRNSGRLAATTSNTANGSVFLQARTGASAVPQDNANIVRSSVGGSITLDATSVIDIAPDVSAGSVAADSNSAFTRSRIELTGQTVDMASGSRIVAPGAMVNVTAVDVPSYNPSQAAEQVTGVTQPSSDTARITMDRGALIDVSGTTNTEVSVARNFVTTELLGFSDLKDAPIQKDGAIYRSKLTFDVRESAPVIGHDRNDANSSYTKGIQKTVGERLATGGEVTLRSLGTVALREGSVVDVSGGQVNYSAAEVSPSLVRGADGKVYTLNTATAGVKITEFVTDTKVDDTRFGPVYSPVPSSLGQVEAAYTEGKAAGALVVQARNVLAEGVVKASVVQGERQRLGRDALAATGRLDMSMVAKANAQGSRALSVVQGPKASADDTFWQAAVQGDIGGGNRLSASTINDSGAGTVNISAQGQVVVEDGAHLQLSDGASFNLTARNLPGVSGGVVLGGDIRGVGANVTVSALRLSADGELADADLTLKSGRRIDVSGQLVNRRQGVSQATALAGGNVTLRADDALDVQDGSHIDVSGGATVAVNGQVVGTRAGAITLQSNSISGAAVHLGASLRGQQMANAVAARNDAGRTNADSGRLTIKAGEVDIVARDGGALIRSGQTADGLTMSDELFSSGGFRNFDVQGQRRLSVNTGAVVAPEVTQWQPLPQIWAAPSGTAMDAVSSSGVTGGNGVGPVTSVSLSSQARSSNNVVVGGELTLAQGSRVAVSPQGSIRLTGGSALSIDGQVLAPGGSVSTDLTANLEDAGAPEALVGTYRVGDQAVIDVSGTTLLTPNGNGLRLGQVLDGGRITLGLTGAKGSTVQIAPGAQLKADGAQNTLHVRQAALPDTPAYLLQSVASSGGSIEINTSAGGAVLAGTLQARGGSDAVLGGSLNVIAQAGNALDPQAIVRLQQQAVDANAPIERGVTTVSADAVAAGGFANLSLTSPHRIELSGPVSLSMRQRLTLDAPVLAQRDAANSALRALSRLTWTSSAGAAPAGEFGGGQLTLQGGMLDLSGTVATEGLAALRLVGDDEIRLRQRTAGSVEQLDTRADVTLSAPLITADSGTRFTLNAPGQAVIIEPGDITRGKPLSAGAAITFNAATIDHHGVVMAPLGQITLQASERVTLHEGSWLSVSGDGMTLPYGTLANGLTAWQLNGQNLSALPDKSITVAAPGQQVDIKPGATLDLSAGGKAVAWEFVAGPGGSKDVFKGSYDNPANPAFAIVPGVVGYAPLDAELLTASEAGSASAFNAARQITIGEGSGVPAGTYTVLPARYALLPGAFLLRPSSQGGLAVGQSQALLDGSTLVGARISTLGAGVSEAQPRVFQVLPQALAKRYSDVREVEADSYFATLATAREQAIPAGTALGGILNLAANRLSLEGSTLFKAGGELNIAANRIRVAASGSGSAPGTPEGAADLDLLTIDDARLNATGAGSILLGGLRQGRDEQGRRLVQVEATEVSVASGAQLRGPDLILAARQKVQVEDGAQVLASTALNGGTGTTSAKATDLVLSGDGALVRASADGTVQTMRQATAAAPITRSSGDVLIGSGAVLSGAALTVEGTRKTAIAASADLAADRLSVGAGRIAAGDGLPPSTSASDDDTLRLTAELSAKLARVRELQLRSFDGIDLVGQAQLGGPAVAKLVLDTPTVRVMSGANGQAGVATVEAGSIGLRNTTGQIATAQADAPVGSQLTIKANGQAGSDGHVVVGSGSVALSGAQNNTVQAAGSIVLDSTRVNTTANNSKAVMTTPVATVLGSSGNLTLAAQSVTARDGRKAEVNAAGLLRVEQRDTPGAVAATPGSGANVLLRAQAIEQAGTVALPSGGLMLQAQGQAGQDSITFESGSRTVLSGTVKTLDGVAMVTSGGDLAATAAQGHVRVRSGAVIDVSAGQSAGQARAGSVSLAAPAGAVILEEGSQLLATSSAGQTGGRLLIDSRDGLPDLSRIATSVTLANGQTLRNFAGEINLRQRVGDLKLDTSLSAARIKVANDGGSVTVTGTLDASGAQGGAIQLSAKGGLVLAAGSLIDTHATAAGAAGGDVQLASAEGFVSLQLDATLNLSGGQGGQGGQLAMRALRTADNSDVQVNVIQATVQGAQAIRVEGVKVYENQATINAAFASQATASAESFTGLDGAQARQMAARIAGTDAALASKLAVRAGIEARSSGNMTVSGDTATKGWNLTRFDDKGVGAKINGQPINLTLRAGGDLLVSSSLSDGFAGTTGDTRLAATTKAAASVITPAGLIQAGEGADLRLVGGADATAADVMAVKAKDQVGSVIIGSTSGDVLVRTTTGNIDIAAAKNIELRNERAVVYTTGRVATPDEVGADYAPPTAISASARATLYVSGSTPVQSPFLVGAGSVSLAAGRDVLSSGTGKSQYSADWWLSNAKLTEAQPQWWSRYDNFQQGVASFGGGGVDVVAGGSVRDLGMASASSGYFKKGSAQATVFEGGAVSVRAQGDIEGVFVHAGGASLAMQAGQDIKASARRAEPQVLYQNTDARIEARQALTLGAITEVGAVTPVTTTSGLFSGLSLLAGLAPQASASITSAGDSVRLTLDTPAGTTLTRPTLSVTRVMPARTQISAPVGTLTVDGAINQVAGSADLFLLAQGDVTLASVNVGTLTEQAQGPRALAAAAWQPVLGALETGSREPVRIVSELGSVSVGGAGSMVANPTRIIAGKDITLRALELQHQSGTELSLVQAGRDVIVGPGQKATEDLYVHGPGDLIVAAGRDVQLRGEGSNTGGINAQGNRSYPVLPEGSANVSVLAGVDLEGGQDYRAATTTYFHVLGGAGVAEHAGEVYAALAAARQGLSLPPLGSAQARAFDQLTPDQQLDQARAFLGAAAYEAVVRQHVQSQSVNAGLSTAQALAAVPGMSSSDKTLLAGRAFALAWRDGLSAAQRQSMALALLADKGTTLPSTAPSLASFVQHRLGLVDAPALGTALAQFEQLPLEQQALFVNQTLIEQVRAAGRAAAKASAAERDQAYAVGYRAIETVFPGSKATSDVLLPTSRVTTSQNSPITLIAPHGGIEVGPLASGNLNVAKLGIVTSAGGDVSALVRDDITVNQSRIFTVGEGDMTLWSSLGGIDAGRGAKTVTGAPPPVIRVINGVVTVDTSGTFSGSGIAVLSTQSALDLFAPKGEINAGDAGISSAGSITLGSPVIRGADAIAGGGFVAPAATVSSPAAAVGSLGQAATSAGAQASTGAARAKSRRSVLLELLGFGLNTREKPSNCRDGVTGNSDCDGLDAKEAPRPGAALDQPVGSTVASR